MSYKYLPADKIKDHYTKSLSVIRTGRVNSSLLDHIFIPAYGNKMLIKELATITIPEPAQLLITPFDKSINVAIEKAIIEANLGINPTNDGAGVRLVFPPLTEETRKARVKEISKLLEEAKINIRTHRQDLLKAKKTDKENGDLSEDGLKRFESELQKEVDNLNEEVENMAKAKEAEILKM